MATPGPRCRVSSPRWRTPARPPVPLLAAYAAASGTVTREAFDRLVGEMEDRLAPPAAGRRPAACAARRAGRRGPARRRRRDHRAHAEDPAAGPADRRQPRSPRPPDAADAAAERVPYRLSRVSAHRHVRDRRAHGAAAPRRRWPGGADARDGARQAADDREPGLHPHDRRAASPGRRGSAADGERGRGHSRRSLPGAAMDRRARPRLRRARLRRRARSGATAQPRSSPRWRGSAAPISSPT